MPVSYQVKEYSNYGKCVCIDNDKMELYVTVDVGPRIIKLNLKGKENMMFNDTERTIYHNEKCLSDCFGEGSKWNIYGGHRFWVSPEKLPDTYYPDNAPVDYSVNGNVFTFSAPQQKYTGWKETLVITVDETAAKASVKHILANMSNEEKTGSIWGLNVTDKDGKVYLKQADEDNGFLPNRTLMIWSYNDVTDKRFHMDNEYISVQQDKTSTTRMKIGTNNTCGTAVCINHGTAFVVRADYIKGASYPDNGCSFEVFTSSEFLEVETLSPLYTLKPGECCEHTEKWELFDENANNVDSVKKYFCKLL